MGVAPSGIYETIRRRPFSFLLGLLMVASAALLIHYRSGLNFMLDDWAFVVYREDGGIGDFLDPHNEHISILPVAIYKLFLSVFGMGSAMPLQVFSVLIFLLSVFALYLYLRPLVGEPAAVIGCAVILFFGSAFEDLLWAFQIGFSLSVAGGIGALIMLRRQDAFGDRIACLLLTVSIISTSLGIPFAVGAAVCLLLQRNDLWRRLYVVAVPILIYGLWYLGWGHTAESSLSIQNVGHAPGYIARSFALTVSELTGISKLIVDDGAFHNTALGVLCGLIGMAAIAYGVLRQGRIPRPLLVAAAIALTFWGLAALNLAPGRGFQASRYQFPNAVFVLMILAGTYEGYRPKARMLAALGLIALVAIAANIEALRNGYNDLFKPLADKGIAGMTAVDIARNTVSPGLEVGISADDSARITAGAYLEAEKKYGSLTWSESEIEQASPAARERVDQILVSALPVLSTPIESFRGTGLTRYSCQTVTAGTAGSEQAIPLPDRTFSFRPQESAFLAFGRYGDGASTGAAFAEAGVKTLVNVPADDSDEPWRIGFLGEGKVRVCPVKPQPLR
ncbi:MAG: hypothetical protein WBP55_12055 [Solirubrobacterales bacterium]